IFIRGDLPFSLPGKVVDCAPHHYAIRWIDNQACTALRRKFRMTRSIVWSEIFAGLMADVYARFSGNGMSKARLHQQNCHRKSLIPRLIRSERRPDREDRKSTRLNSSHAL